MQPTLLKKNITNQSVSGPVWFLLAPTLVKTTALICDMTSVGTWKVTLQKWYHHMKELL